MQSQINYINTQWTRTHTHTILLKFTNRNPKVFVQHFNFTNVLNVIYFKANFLINIILYYYSYCYAFID